MWKQGGLRLLVVLAAAFCVCGDALADRVVHITFVNQSPETRAVFVAGPGMPMRMIGSFREGGVLAYDAEVPDDQPVTFAWRSERLGGTIRVEPGTPAYLRIDLTRHEARGPYAAAEPAEPIRYGRVRPGR